MITRQQKLTILELLKLGHSIRAIERITGINRNTVMRYHNRSLKRKPGRPALGIAGRNKTVLVRFTDTEYAAIVETAKNCKSLSEWIRRTLRKRAKTDEETNHQTTVFV